MDALFTKDDQLSNIKNAKSYDGFFRLAFWMDAPEGVEPALVIIHNRGLSFSTVILDDSIDDLNLNRFQIPSQDIEKYFRYLSDSICPPEMKANFHVIQKYLIDKGLPMAGPLTYARTAWLMYHKGMCCQDAMDKSQKTEEWMIDWVKKSISTLESVAPWMQTGDSPS